MGPSPPKRKEIITNKRKEKDSGTTSYKEATISNVPQITTEKHPNKKQSQVRYSTNTERAQQTTKNRRN